MLVKTEMSHPPEKFGNDLEKKIFLRKKMQEELDAVNSYEDALEREKDEKTKEVFSEIIRDELNHFGRLMREWNRIDKTQMELIQKGIEGKE